MSCFYGIGVGVGDPEMLTIKCIKTLEKLDIIVLPEAKLGEGSIAYNIVESFLKNHVEKLFLEFSMSKDINERKESRRVNGNKIKEYLKLGKNVGLVTIGDPMIYSTYSYILEEIEGVFPVETIPGIPTFIDIASRINRPLVLGDESLKIISLNEDCDIEEEIKNSDNLVFMKVKRDFNRLKEAIYKSGNRGNVILVSNSGKENQEIIYDLDSVEGDKLSYFTTIILKKGGI